MANTLHGPYTKGASLVSGPYSAGGAYTNQEANNAETQSAVALASLNPDLVGAGFVLSGVTPTRHNAYAAKVLATETANLLRYYRLDESGGSVAVDISGQGQDGTTHGSPTQGVAGLLVGDPDTCYTFAAASNQYISVPTTGLPTGNGAFSYGVWFKFAANPGSSIILAGFGGTANKTGCTAWIDTAGKLNTDVNTGTGQITSASAVSTAVAHFACVTWDGTTLRLYLDGASVGTPTTPGALTLSSTFCNIGAGAAGGYYSGQLDEAAFWSIALTLAEISALYTTGTTATTQLDIASGEAYLIQSDGTLCRCDVGATSETTVTINTTYNLYLQPDGTWYWSTSNSPQANSLKIASVTTDGSGNVKLITDTRPTTITLFPNAIGALQWPTIVARALGVSITSTQYLTVLNFVVPATGHYRVSGTIWYSNGTPQAAWLEAQWEGGFNGSAQHAYLATIENGGSGHSGANVLTLSPTSGNALSSSTEYTILPHTMWAQAGQAVAITFADPGGTPADVVNIILERIA